MSIDDRSYFLSYSDDQGKDRKTRDFVFKLRDALLNGSPSFKLWLFNADDIVERDWDSQAEQVIRNGDGLLLVMNEKSVQDTSECKSEWTEALRCKKPIVLVQFEPGVKPPMRLNRKRRADFTGDFDAGLTKLRDLLTRLKSPTGELETLRERRGETADELSETTDTNKRTRLEDEVVVLDTRIEERERLVADPVGTAQRNRARIEKEIKEERQTKAVPPGAQGLGARGGLADDRVINQTPAETPMHYQNRVPEARRVSEFLADDSKRMLVVWGRSGIGKTAVVCRVLNHLRRYGQLPDSNAPFDVNGVVFLNARTMTGVAWPYFYADLCRLLPPSQAAELQAVFKDDQRSLVAKAQALTTAFARGRTVVLVDNFEDLIDPQTEKLKESDFDAALCALLEGPQHGIKLILTTQIVPRTLAQVQPGRQGRLPLDKGLEAPFAEDILRSMDAEGVFGLKSAPDELLARARECTRGHPKALEVLFGAVASDWNTSLAEIVETAERALQRHTVVPAEEELLPESVMRVLVGEAFSRLDGATQQVMQALAVFNRAVSTAAVDYLLLPYVKGISATPILRRLVNWHFVRKEGQRYDLHSIDRAYVFGQLPRGSPDDRQPAVDPPFTQFALLHRAAEYFRQNRAPKTEWLKRDDLDYQVAEFELRCDGEEYDEAARVLFEIDNDYLSPWGLDREVVRLHERLQGHLTDARLRLDSLGRLGKVHFLLSRYHDAIRCLQEALAIAGTLADRLAEADALSSLGLCHFRQGDFIRAIDLEKKALALIGEDRTLGEERVWLEANHALGFSHSAVGETLLAMKYTEAALDAARRLHDKRQESYQLGFLGLYSSYMGDTRKALDYDREALRQARDLNLPRDVVCHLGFLAEVCCTQLGDYDAAIHHAEEALRIENEISSPLNGSWCNQWLAVARGLKGDLVGARRAADEACRFDEPLNNQNSTAVLGVIALRQGDEHAARKALDAAVAWADQLLLRCDKNWEALDAKGLALSGLALYDGPDRLRDAVSTFEAARRVTADPGSVRRALRQMELLAPADSNASLAPARAAAGERS